MRLAPAPVGRRIGAYLIDAVVGTLVVAAAVGIGAAAEIAAGVPWFMAAPVVVVAWALVFTGMQGGKGSIGMRVVGLRLVRVEGSELPNAEGLGFGKALLRNIVWGLAASIFVGYFSVLFDSTGRGQGWHDRAAGAVMIDARVDAPAPVVAPRAAAPAGPMLQAPSFDRLPPTSVPDVAPPAVPDAAPAAAVPASPVPASPVPAPAPAPAPVTDSLIAHVPGITLSAPATGDIAATRIARSPRSVALVWDDGTRHTVTSRTLFGRNPAAESGAVTVAVRDETLSLSKSHFEIDVTPEGAWLTDRHSTNGVTLVRAGNRITCSPSQPEALLPGDALEIGDRVATIGGTS